MKHDFMGSEHVARLTFNHVEIRDRGEMLSLTDMWKAQGAPEHREPFNWVRKEGAPFIEAVAVAHNLTDGQVMATKRGKGGSTFAHWQIGLAYAKYLSPEFHMWCNTVVRRHMERLRGDLVGLDPRGIAILESMVDAKLKRELPVALAAFMPNGSPDGVTAGEVCQLSRVMTNYPRGVAARVSNRLTEFCRRHGESPRLARLGTARAQLFPTNLARQWLNVEGKILIQRWATEKAGQGRLKLI